MADSNGYNIKSIREQFRKAGVFYTPPELAERMAKYLPNDVPEVYDPDWANKTNEQVEASEVKRIQRALNWALTVRQLDNTISKPIDDFVDEIEKVVENFRKSLQ